MTDPTPPESEDLTARARACFAELNELSMMPSVIERHMAALVADKDAEIAEIHRGRTEYLEEMGFTPSCNWDEAIAEAKELREDLDRHVAALKVAVDALKWCAPKCEHCNAMADALSKVEVEQFAISTELARMLKDEDGQGGFQQLCCILSGKNLSLSNERRELRSQLEASQAECKRLKFALKFYASESVWENDKADFGDTTAQVPYTAPIFTDFGQIARAAMQPSETAT